jgi:hypothetical protein
MGGGPFHYLLPVAPELPVHGWMTLRYLPGIGREVPVYRGSPTRYLRCL